jgi:hypothetical protein
MVLTTLLTPTICLASGGHPVASAAWFQKKHGKTAILDRTILG